MSIVPIELALLGHLHLGDGDLSPDQSLGALVDASSTFQRLGLQTGHREPFQRLIDLQKSGVKLMLILLFDGDER